MAKTKTPHPDTLDRIVYRDHDRFEAVNGLGGRTIVYFGDHPEWADLSDEKLLTEMQGHVHPDGARHPEQEGDDDGDTDA